MPYADVPGRTTRRFYYDDTGGPGPLIIFSHGFMMDRTMFAQQVEMLSQNFRCICWDQRGHGLTATDRLSPFRFYDSADDLNDFIDFLGLPPAILVGMSQGGFLTLRTAISNPDAVAALILIDTEAGVMTQTQIDGNEKLLQAWISQGFSQGLGEMIASQILGPGEDGQPWSGTQAWIDKWAQDKLVNLIPCFDALIYRQDVTSILGAITPPACVIHGSVDQSVPPAAGQAMATGLKNASFNLIDGAGHASNLTHGPQVNAVIETFLTTLALLPPPPVPAPTPVAAG